MSELALLADLSSAGFHVFNACGLVTNQPSHGGDSAVV